VILEAIPAGTGVPGRINIAGQVPGESSSVLQHLALQVGGLATYFGNRVRPYAQQRAKKIGEVRKEHAPAGASTLPANRFPVGLRAN